MSEQFAIVPRSKIFRSPTNPRKTFDATKLQELADNIKATGGVHQPVLLRPLPGKYVPDSEPEQEYELVCGERRERASELAGLDTIPAMIKPLTDAQVLEIQLVENLQRDDLLPLEEAEGYERMMYDLDISADQVAEKIGKSRSYVYGRLKLLDLSLLSKQALREGKLDPSRALLIARVPDDKLQAKALKHATTADWQGELPSYRALSTWLKQNVMLRLEDATFKLTDARLVVEAGSCTECPKRTGCNPDLFADVDGADICTDPPCYHRKTEAHSAQLRAMAEKKGMRIVEGQEASELLQRNLYRSTPPGYSSLSELREDAIDATDDHSPRLRDLLGDDAPAPILFEHPKTKELTELVPTQEAEAILLAKGLIQPTQEQQSTTSRQLTAADIEANIERIKKIIDRDTRNNAHTEIYAQAWQQLHAESPETTCNFLATFVAPILRGFFETEINLSMDPNESAEMLGLTLPDEVEDPEAYLIAQLKTLGTHTLSLSLARYMLLRDKNIGYHQTETAALDAFASVFNINRKPIEKAARTKAFEPHKDELHDLQGQLAALKSPQTPPAATAPAARPKEGPGGKAGKKKPAPAARLSPEEATQGIAAAMQENEGQASAKAVAPAADPAGVAA